ncbi:hypothetical protein MRX96_056203 [Rhipicephalus microplus]
MIPRCQPAAPASVRVQGVPNIDVPSAGEAQLGDAAFLSHARKAAVCAPSSHAQNALGVTQREACTPNAKKPRLMSDAERMRPSKFTAFVTRRPETKHTLSGVGRLDVGDGVVEFRDRKVTHETTTSHE